jgi:hypothetical protein
MSVVMLPPRESYPLYATFNAVAPAPGFHIFSCHPRIARTIDLLTTTENSTKNSKLYPSSTMDAPKDPPMNLTQPSNFLSPAAVCLNSDFMDYTSPSELGLDIDSPIDPVTEDVVFGARAVDQAALEREVASKVSFLYLD